MADPQQPRTRRQPPTEPPKLDPADAAPDAPVLDDPETPAPEPVLELTQTQLDDMLARVAEEAAERATRAAARPTTAVINTAQAVDLTRPGTVPTDAARAMVPTEPTYEEGYVDDEDGVAYSGTIIAISPEGRETECTPKVFRTVLQPKGFLAHPSDAVQNLSTEPRRTRRSNRADAEGDGTPEPVTAARRRRRAAVSG